VKEIEEYELLDPKAVVEAAVRNLEEEAEYPI